MTEMKTIRISLGELEAIQTGDTYIQRYAFSILGDQSLVTVLSTNDNEGKPEVLVNTQNNQVKVEFTMRNEEIASVNSDKYQDGTTLYTVTTLRKLAEEEDSAYAEIAKNDMNRRKIAPAQSGLAWKEHETEKQSLNSDNPVTDDELRFAPGAYSRAQNVIDEATALFDRKSQQVVISMTCPFDDPASAQLSIDTQFSYQNPNEPNYTKARTFRRKTLAEGQITNLSEPIVINNYIPDEVTGDYILTVTIRNVITGDKVERVFTKQEIEGSQPSNQETLAKIAERNAEIGVGNQNNDIYVIPDTEWPAKAYTPPASRGNSAHTPSNARVGHATTSERFIKNLFLTV